MYVNYAVFEEMLRNPFEAFFLIEFAGFFFPYL